MAAGVGPAPQLSARERDQTVGIHATGATAGAGRCAELNPGAGYRVVELRADRLGEGQVSRAVRVHFIERGGERRLLGVER